MDQPILIFSSMNEPCTDWVEKELRLRGSKFIRINYEESLTDTLWDIEISNNGIFLKINGHIVQPKAVWMRRWGYPLIPKMQDELSKFFVFNEFLSMSSGLSSLIDTKWINHPHKEKISTNKILQLVEAKELGWEIPNTLISNNLHEVIKFRNKLTHLIFKPVSANQSSHHIASKLTQVKMSNEYPEDKYDYGDPHSPSLIFTQELTNEKLEYLHALKWTPVNFQQKIIKKSDIRVTVIGKKIFSCRIKSQNDTKTSLDFRYMNIIGNLPHEKIELGSEINARILLLMNKLGLVFGCLDFIEKHNGDLVFLEVNPSGQWLWIEQLTGMKISQAFAEELIS